MHTSVHRKRPKQRQSVATLDDSRLPLLVNSYCAFSRRSPIPRAEIRQYPRMGYTEGLDLEDTLNSTLRLRD